MIKRYKKKDMIGVSHYIRIGLTLVLFIVCACSKEKLPEPTAATGDNKNLLAESKQWYQKKKPIDQLKMAAIKLSVAETKDFIGIPQWDKAAYYTYRTDLPIFIRIPLTGYTVNSSYTKRMSSQGFRDLVLLKKSTGNFLTDVIEIHPDEDYIDRKKRLSGNSDKSLRELVDDKDFTGYFLVYTLNNDLRYGERRENGVAKKRIVIK